MSNCTHENVKRDEKYDSFYCADCVEWVEDKCHDKTCHFCKDRPPKPDPRPNE